MANPLCLHCYRTYETIRSSTYLLSQHEAMASFRSVYNQTSPSSTTPLSKMAFVQESNAFADIYAPGQDVLQAQQIQQQQRQPQHGGNGKTAGPAFVPALPPPTTKSPPPINSLPTELLDEVLSSFSTQTVLPFAGVNRRFHNIVARLLYRRLRKAVALANHQLILACYHPSAKISSPYLNCTYLGTEGLDLPCVGDDDSAPEGTLLRLPSMYSRFRPVPPDESDVHYRNYRAIRRTMNFFLLSDTTSGGTAATALQAAKEGAPLVSYDVHLDEGELFSQLCTVTNLVKTSAQPGLFLNCVNINDGVIRVWRDWLDRRVADQNGAEQEDAKEGTKEKASSSGIPSIVDTNQHVLWAYTGKHVGMRFRVTETTVPADRLAAAAAVNDLDAPHSQFRRATMPPDEPPVSFMLEYEELLVRSYELLLAMEEVELQDKTQETRGVVVSSL